MVDTPTAADGRSAPPSAAGQPAWERLLARVEPHVCAPGDDDETRRRRVLFVLTAVFIAPAGLLWGVLLAVAYEQRAAALIPVAYTALTAVGVLVMVRTRRAELFRRTQMLLILLLPVALQVAMGGFVASGAIGIWSFICVLFAALFADEAEARVWWGAFVVAIVVATLIEPGLDGIAGIPEWRIVVLFLLNVTVVSSIAFAVLRTFMGDRRRLRELELAYLNQDIMLRQSERLATLGTLAAGVAHELNNPAAAAVRGVDRLGEVIERLRAAALAGASDGDPAAQAALERIAALDATRDARVGTLSPLARSDREEELDAWLRDGGVPKAAQTAAALVADGYRLDDLRAAVDGLPPERAGALVDQVATAGSAARLLASVADSAGRISAIVGAMRSYTNLDRAPVQEVDALEGLESTLVLLGARLRDVEVRRELAPDLPRIEANAGELNQVWTNMIENAVQAMDGRGVLTLGARRAGPDAIEIAIGDDGPGMEPAVAARVFDAFFTTKEPGRGTGLGLNISHNIVVGAHGGRIDIDTHPGAGTTFRVTLPLRRPARAVDQPSAR